MQRDGGSAAVGNSWATLGATTAIQALVALAALAMPVLAPLIVQGTGTESSMLAGSLAASVYLGAALATVVAGPVIRRLGAIRTSQLGLCVCAAGLILGAGGPNWGAVLGAFVIGLGYGPITPASSHLLVRTTPARRMSLVFSVKQTGVPLGGLLAGAIAPGLGLLCGWRVALVLLVVPCLVMAWLSQPMHHSLDADRDPRVGLNWKAMFAPLEMVWRHAKLRRLALASMLFTFAQLSITAYSVSHLHDSLGVGLVAAGVLLSVAQTGGILGRIGWGFVSDTWLGPRVTLTVLAVAMAVCSVSMAWLEATTPSWIIGALMLVFGAVAVGWNGVYLAQVARSAPQGMEGSATGGSLMFTFMGNVLGPIGIAAAIQYGGSMASAYALLAIPLFLAGVILFVERDGVRA